MLGLLACCLLITCPDHRYHTELASLKVDGELPRLQVVISSMQIKHLVDLGKSLGEDFSGGPEQAKPDQLSIQDANKPTATETAATSREMVTVGLSPEQIEIKKQKRVTQSLNKALDVNFVVGEVGLTNYVQSQIHPHCLTSPRRSSLGQCYCLLL